MDIKYKGYSNDEMVMSILKEKQLPVVIGGVEA